MAKMENTTRYLLVSRRRNAGKRYEVMGNVNGGIDIDCLLLKELLAFYCTGLLC